MYLWLKQPHTEEEVKDRQEVIDILTETIEALDAEIKEVITLCFECFKMLIYQCSN